MGAAGGVGLAAVEIGKAMGARVIAATSSAAKLAVAKECGADDTIDYSSTDLNDAAKALTDKRGVDVIFDPVGGSLAERAIRAMAWKGRYLVIGFAAGAIPSLPLNLTLVKGCSIVGVFWGNFAKVEPQENARNTEQLIAWYREGKIRPRITLIEGLDRAVEGLRQIADRKAVGKLVVRIA
jgi:NADPH2:quinone reductase